MAWWTIFSSSGRTWAIVYTFPFILFWIALPHRLLIKWNGSIGVACKYTPVAKYFPSLNTRKCTENKDQSWRMCYFIKHRQVTNRRKVVRQRSHLGQQRLCSRCPTQALLQKPCLFQTMPRGVQASNPCPPIVPSVAFIRTLHWLRKSRQSATWTRACLMLAAMAAHKSPSRQSLDYSFLNLLSVN